MGDVPQKSYGCAGEDHAERQASLAKSKQVKTDLFGTVQLLCRTLISFCKHISVNISNLDLRCAIITSLTPGHLVRRDSSCL